MIFFQKYRVLETLNNLNRWYKRKKIHIIVIFTDNIIMTALTD